ncbi:MAG: ASKHA domain-containing protein [Deltaproteobacteria bacterium]|nr:ASKHA domain-containing protein [Deltaproteobacteria bacterium]
MNLTIIQSGLEDLTISIPDGQTIMEALKGQGLNLDAPCAGRGRCGKCLVSVKGDFEPPSESELEILSGRTDLRLACQAKGLGDVTVVVEAKALFSALKGLGWTAPYNFDPPISLIEVGERDRRDQRPLMRALDLSSENYDVLSQLSVLEANRTLGKVLFSHHKLLGAWETHDGPNENLAAAFDLGTTGLALALIDLNQRQTVAMETALNPQTAVGGDVISRMTYAAESPEKIQHLQNLALEGLAGLVAKAVDSTRAKNIGAAVICGNTTMLHLLAGLNPKSLAQAPYRPIFVDRLNLSHLAQKIGLPPWAEVTTAPSISAYVGGDITSGLTAIKLSQRPGTVIFIDIGTNGEIVLSKDNHLVATSCAAGPALEGMNISCGMRAVTGAIDSFQLAPDMTPTYTTIGGVDPKGFCGSGLIDIVAELIRSEVITKTGRFSPSSVKSGLIKDGQYHLTDEVFLSQKDIRQVQLAKGAISAAMKMLLERFELTLSDLDEVVIAGSFGYHLKAENLLAISLIPKGYTGPITFVGNSSLAGAARLLLDRLATLEIDSIAQNVEVIELGFDPKFQETFVKELSF